MKHPRFFDLFPTPKFLEMPAPGLAVNDSGLKFIEFGTTSHGLTLKRYGKADLPKDIIVNGVIEDRENFIRALEDFRKSFDLRYIRTSLPEERAYLFQTSIADIPENEIYTAVEAVIEENVPLSVSEVVFDYSILPKTKAEDDAVRVSVSVVPEDVVMEYLDVFRQAGFVPLHFNIESQAVTRALFSPHDVGLQLIINVDRTKIGLYVVSRGSVSFTSTLATPVIQEGTAAQAPFADTVLSALDAEIRKVFLYVQTQADRMDEPREPIESIFLCGECAGKEGLMEHLSDTHGIKVELANVWKNTFSFNDYVPEISKEESLAYVAAVGLALPRQELR